ncbi:methyltransferase domain-containing protein [Cryobacterium luteum]|uniref:Methyltransferase domain-containing protein n=2 Tax=Cryobacterium luteum TaxID=1424661 RepID=A0A1H8DAX4_9MICO|nr:methyltransferase domain-containing protein [Cryobacterium luteum]SEN03964.1 23S rRNA m(1)G-748 methyltransferase [Cryobacterium luteum]
MSLQTLAEWLRCPNCFLPLHPSGHLLLTCERGHSYDVNKRGFVNLLTGPRKFIGDSAAMLDARDRFLAAGWYEPLRDAICSRAAGELPRRILDVGCGTGYYLGAALPSGDDVRALGMDLSPIAVGRTIRSHDRVDGLVADVWSPLPLRDGTADIILNVFAPRNAAEFHRALRHDGLLLVVVPQPSHLRQLRESGLAVQMQADKAVHLTTSLAAWFSLESHDQLARTVRLSVTEVASLVGMGPSAHHIDSAAEADPVTPDREVTVAFDIFGFRRH